MKIRNISILSLLLASVPMVLADNPVSSALNTVFETIFSIFGTFLTPGAEGLSILMKFLVIVIVFAIAYEANPLPWRPAIKGIVAGAIALIAGLALPTKLALTTASIYSSLLVGAILLAPFIGLVYLSWLAIQKWKTKWVYPTLALAWFFYFVILSYFLATWQLLPGVFEWVFYGVLVLATLSPLIILILLGALIFTDDTAPRSSFKELLKNWKKGEVRDNAKEFGREISDAHAVLSSIKATHANDTSRNKIVKTIGHLNRSKRSADVLANAAARLIAEVDSADLTDEDKLKLAQSLLTDVGNLITGLTSVAEKSSTAIKSYIDSNTLVGNNKQLSQLAQRAVAVQKNSRKQEN